MLLEVLAELGVVFYAIITIVVVVTDFPIITTSLPKQLPLPLLYLPLKIPIKDIKIIRQLQIHITL